MTTFPPKVLGQEFCQIDEERWMVCFGMILDVILKHHPDDHWEWIIGSSAYNADTLEECLDALARELRFLRRELGLDIHQQTGIDAYAIHLGRQAANGLILEHETRWLEEYDRRRIHERRPT